MHEFKKIGVWNTAFLGDAVLTLHLIQALRDAYPNAEIHFFVRGGLESLFQNQTNLSSAIGFYKRDNQKKLDAAYQLGKKIRSQGFDLWISTHTSLRSAFLAKCTRIPMRIGYNSPWYNRLAYTHTVSRRFHKLEEIERLMQLTLPLGIHGPAPETKLIATPISNKSLPQGPLLGVHPGSTWPTKKWPLPYFAEIARRARNAGAGLVLFGGADEEADAQAIIQAAGLENDSRVLNLAGKLDLPRLAGYIASMDVYLSNDSGPMHLAWMQKVPTIALFGPTVRQLGFFPRGKHTQVLEVAELNCRPCGLHGSTKCPQAHFKCMLQLSPEQVWAAVEKRLFR